MSILIPLILVIGACERETETRVVPDPWVFTSRPALEVEVETTTGAPIAGAWVTLAPGGRDAETDASGVARFGGLGAGVWDAQVAAEGFEAASFEVTVLEDDVIVSQALDAVDSSSALVGLVTDPYGDPVRDAVLVVDGAEAAVTGLDGRYVVRGLSEGPHEVWIRSPGVRLGDWYVRRMEVVAGGRAVLDATLPGQPTEQARFIGSGTCLLCHGGAAEPGGKWFGTPHAEASRTPAELAGTPLEAEFQAGRVVSLEPAVSGATVVLAAPAPGQWTAEVVDTDLASTGALPVLEVYGGHRTGAALAADDGGTRVLVPIVWALPGQGLSSEQDPAGWVAAFTDEWFDGAALDPSASGTSFDLRCGGCHATGHAIEEGDGDVWELVPALGAGPVERDVGCEACHGAGSEHAARPQDARRTIYNPSRAPASWRLETCARCHERVADEDHDFGRWPAAPYRADGRFVPPNAVLSDHAAADPYWWAAVPASRTLADQVGELRGSPHRQGPTGYDGACEDCHDPHGSSHAAALKRDPGDNFLCTRCHVSAFPDPAAEQAHSHHPVFDPGDFGPGTCTRCHLGRSGLEVRHDAVSGVGELHSHALVSFDPNDILVEFDLAGSDNLPLGDVPISPCLDCHLQVDAAAREEGEVCACTLGDPLYRVTYENLARIVDEWWGTQP